jgi:tetratricopeptide (TPR) repeat protein
MPEAMLLQAEILYGWGDFSTAFNILQELLNRTDTPDWMRFYIEILVDDARSMQDEAQVLVEQNPDDPQAYLVLYETNLALGMYDEAEKAVQQALNLAGDDPAISNEAGNIAVAYGLWLQAAYLYSYAAKISPDGISAETGDRIIEALYYGSAEEGAIEILSEIEISLPGREDGITRRLLRDTLIARYKLYYEDFEEAEIIVEDIINQAPNFSLARLVQAEVHLFKGDHDESRRILQELEGKNNISPWMQFEIESMLQYLNP